MSGGYGILAADTILGVRIMIVYYTGTGNSRYAAEYLASAIGDEMMDAAPYIQSGTAAALTSEKPWVFVSPTYGWRIPRIFREFIERGTFSGSREAYFVMTCGSEIGNAGTYLQKLCAETGFVFRGVQEVVMPENYVAMFYVPGETESAEIRASADKTLAQAAAFLRAGQTLPHHKAGLIDRVKSTVVNPVFYAVCISSKAFTVSDACIGCGKCAASCPVTGIALKNDRPVWTGACTHCMACICGCPTAAIEYGRKSLDKPRYQCPHYEEGRNA